MADYKNFRLVPYGHPDKNDNISLNPGRYKIGPKSCMGYYDSVADPWTLVLVDKLMAETPEEDEARAVPPLETPNPNLNSTSASNYPFQSTGIPNEDGIAMPVLGRRGTYANDEPDYSESWIVNRKNTWASGPPVNSAVMDNAIPGAGYWTYPDGPNNEGDKWPGYQMTTSSDHPKILFNMGHGNVASQGGSPGTNVIGWDGEINADKQGSKINKLQTLIGFKHAYAMYTCDLTLSEKIDLVKALIAWVEENFPDEIPDAFAGYGNPTNEVINEQVRGILGSSTRAPSVQLVIRVIKAIIKVIEQAQSDGVVGGLVVNWDFLAELTVPTAANEVKYNDYFWGEYTDTWQPKRFSYVIESDARAFIQILKLRANGVLWHITSPPGGARTRILRTYNFAHIYSPLIFSTDLNDSKNRKFMQVLPEYDKNRDPHAWYDKHFYVDTNKV